LEILLPSEDIGRNVQRTALGAVLVLLLGFLIAFIVRLLAAHNLARDTSASAASIPAVDVVTVQKALPRGTLTLPGETAAWYESTIYARVNGYVAKWYVDIGDHVKAGQVLALIDAPELDAEFAAAKAKLKVSQAQARVKQADAEFAASTYERWRDSPKGVVSEQEREDKKAANTGAVAQLEAAKAQVSLDQADVDRLSAFEQFKHVTAPYTGAITERRIDIGNLVTAGSSSGTTLLYRMAQDDPIRIFVDVPQNAAPDLMKVGVAAKILTGDASAAPINAAVTRTSDAIDPRARTFRAEMDIPNSDGRLVPGLYVQVAFELRNNGMSQVPAAALIFGTTGPRVAVVGPDGTVSFHPVTIGRDDGDTVELSSGVAEGEQLVLNISNQIIAGEKVRISSTLPTGGSNVTTSPLR
jgi:RND family efflux transporter MFP subunit